MVLMIDNYDSFTYNLVQYFMGLGEEVVVKRNDEITVEEAEGLEFDYLVISPGPGRPDSSGCSKDMITNFMGKKPILGVCLGHQTIAELFGGKIVQAEKIMHGKTDMVTHDGKNLFAGLPNPLKLVRYHSLVLEESSLPEDFEITSKSSDGAIMGIRHKTERVEGVQFHPESIASESGYRILYNFLNGIKEVPPVKKMLANIVAGIDLSLDEASHITEEMVSGNMTEAQIGAFMTGMTMKGVKVQELSGIASVLLKKAKTIPEMSIELTDTCGTGGDSSGSFNISTASAFVAAGAGVSIAKHGNRSITSKSGSADLLEKLNIKIDLSPEDAALCIEECGFAFLFAPNYHSAFKNIMGPRRQVGFRTLFNIIGPLINPARVKQQVIGVFAPELTELVAGALNELGVKRAFVVHGDSGLDEISLTGTTKVTEVKDGWVKTYYFDPQDYGFEYCKLEDLKGGDAEENANMIMRILQGAKGPHRDVVVLNAAAAIVVSGIAKDFAAGIALAKSSLDSGAALARLESVVEFSKRVTG